MKRFFVLNVAVLALLAGSTMSSLWSQDRPVPLRLGFIDIKKALDTYRKQRDVMEQLKQKSDAFISQLKQRAKVVDEQSDKLNTMNAGSEEYAQLDEQIAAAKATLDIAKKSRGRELDREQRKKRALIYKEICEEAHAYGQENGLAAVLLYLPPDMDFDQDLDIIMGTRAVLCRDEQLDVTEAVVKRLNAQLPPPTPTVDPDPKKPPK